MNSKLPIIIFLIVSIGCDSGGDNQKTALSGHIINPIGNIVSLRIDQQDFIDTLDDNNSFHLDLDITEPVEARFRHGNEITYIYLSPGDDLSLSLDTDAFDETLTYAGTGSAGNKYNAAIVLLEDTLIGTSEFIKMTPDSFLKAADSISNLKISFLDDFDIEDERFKNYKRQSAKWQLLDLKMEYGAYISNNIDSISLPENYSFLDQLDLNDPMNLKIPAFKNFLTALLNKESESSNSDQSIDEYFSSYYLAIEKFISNDIITQDLLYDLLSRYYSYLDESLKKTAVDKWRSTNPPEEHLIEINDLIDSWRDLAPGLPAPSFTYTSIDGETVSLEDFRGNVVYVDVWATWCRPCLAEQPDMAKLQGRFKGKPVTFIAVSIDPQPEQWVTMVNERQLGGIHLYAPGEYQSEINKAYLISGIPRFILIDPDGMIVDANADRPSMGAGDQIEEVLNKAFSSIALAGF
ncbi:MAG: TlpA family protein disulfide reductase [Bacteroidota bacterium]